LVDVGCNVDVFVAVGGTGVLVADTIVVAVGARVAVFAGVGVWVGGTGVEVAPGVAVGPLPDLFNVTALSTEVIVGSLLVRLACSCTYRAGALKAHPLVPNALQLLQLLPSAEVRACKPSVVFVGTVVSHTTLCQLAPAPASSAALV
jgi:hypothetical protein